MVSLGKEEDKKPQLGVDIARANNSATSFASEQRSASSASTGPPAYENWHYRDPPVLRLGSKGANWRHLSEYNGHLGQNFCFVDGLVKQVDANRYPPTGNKEKSRRVGPHPLMHNPQLHLTSHTTHVKATLQKMKRMAELQRRHSSVHIRPQDQLMAYNYPKDKKFTGYLDMFNAYKQGIHDGLEMNFTKGKSKAKPSVSRVTNASTMTGDNIDLTDDESPPTETTKRTSRPKSAFVRSTWSRHNYGSPGCKVPTNVLEPYTY